MTASRALLQLSRTAFAALAATATSFALAQSPAVQPELANAAFLLGKWQGSGWVEFQPGRRAEFNQYETISARLGGGGILMEGLGKRKGTEIVTHEALGILTWDATQKKPLMRAYKSGGQFVDADVKLEPNKLVWQFPAPQSVEIRFTIVLDEKGRWFEIGEMKKDGTAWSKFFETTLEKAQP